MKFDNLINRILPFCDSIELLFFAFINCELKGLKINKGNWNKDVLGERKALFAKRNHDRAENFNDKY